MHESKEFLLTSPDEAKRYRASGAWPDETIYDRFERVALAHADKVAIIESHRQLSYGELLRIVKSLSQGLLAAGVKAGDVVAVQMPNGAEQPIVHLAANRIGAIAMPIHDAWHEAELPHLLSSSRAVVAIVPARYKDVDYPAIYAGLRAGLPHLKRVFAIGGASAHAEPYESLLANAGDTAMPRVDPDALAALMLSSGTTSMPKISAFTSNNIFALLAPFWRRIRLSSNDVAAALAPAGTGAIGYVYPVLSPLLHGATTVILERWTEPEAGVELLCRHHCTYATAVPAQLTQMLPAIKARPPGAFASFRCFTNAGAPLPPDVGRQVEEQMDCKIFVIYGATDGGVAAASDLDDTQEQRLTTVGRPQEECEIRLIDEIGEPVAPGKPGEIQWRSADKSFGYLNDPEGTSAAFTDDRYYRTGDLGSFDENGYLRIVGRVKDMINRGGRNISPRFIEEVVIKHPQVVEVSVAACPDPVLGERACAFVVLKPGSTMTLSSLLDFLKAEKMSVWQMPERLELLDELPKSAGGKVMKNKLREYVAAKVQAEAQAGAASLPLRSAA